ncbi:glycosyl hydrolase 108 family protein [Hydrogenophaga sp. 2FB]|uniref:glycoside hydrolase family 108 protein n=1 Tax=Hydrogenophaga sp. 2FB TaxID=2502187 RepID=UPI0010F6D326|nr:glycosyl hydrolase 108 family protein [Hydrogenophaga sp. 2FB]
MNFDDAFHALLGHEGGYVDHPKDPGGATCWGVTERVARATGYSGHMRDLPVDLAKAIYRRDYWDAVKADQLPAAVRYAVFDAAVNSGVKQAVKWLQRSVGAVDDGALGPKTLALVSEANAFQLKSTMLGTRLQFMTDLPTWPAFGKGWARRIAALLGT